VRVLVVDDHPIIISGCRALLETDPSVEVFEAQVGAAGFAAFFDTNPDVALIDINLPGPSGLELLRRILQRAPEARLVMFSMNDDPVVAARAIEAGAKGYVAKNDDPALFAEAVRAVARVTSFEGRPRFRMVETLVVPLALPAQCSCAKVLICRSRRDPFLSSAREMKPWTAQCMRRSSRSFRARPT
jgi:CheY-like chemotaxis protein